MQSAEAKAKASAAKEQVVWNPDFIEVTVGQGSSKRASISFAVSAQLNDASLLAVSDIAGLMHVSPLGQTVLNPGAPITVPIELSVPATTAPGVYEGTVYLRSGKQTLPTTLKMKILVVQGSKN
jgi:hypothetical protein